MSDYRYENLAGFIDVRPSVEAGKVYLWVHEGSKNAEIRVPNNDAPAVAAELLKAAGYDYLAGYIEGDIDHRDRLAEKAEAEAAEKKLTERRDAVLAALFGLDLKFEELGPRSVGRTAIARIIELQDNLASRD